MPRGFPYLTFCLSVIGYSLIILYFTKKKIIAMFFFYPIRNIVHFSTNKPISRSFFFTHNIIDNSMCVRAVERGKANGCHSLVHRFDRDGWRRTARVQRAIFTWLCTVSKYTTAVTEQLVRHYIDFILVLTFLRCLVTVQKVSFKDKILSCLSFMRFISELALPCSMAALSTENTINQFFTDSICTSG